MRKTCSVGHDSLALGTACGLHRITSAADSQSTPDAMTEHDDEAPPVPSIWDGVCGAGMMLVLAVLYSAARIGSWAGTKREPV